MFSATFPDDTQQLAKTALKTNYWFATTGVVGSANKHVKQEIIYVVLNGRQTFFGRKLLIGFMM